jgi:hypothetical protein
LPLRHEGCHAMTELRTAGPDTVNEIRNRLGPCGALPTNATGRGVTDVRGTLCQRAYPTTAKNTIPHISHGAFASRDGR